MRETKKTTRSQWLVNATMIAALYVVLTFAQNTLLPGTASMPVQFRVAEVVTIFALYTSAAIPGLTVGCIIANLSSIAALGAYDLVLHDYGPDRMLGSVHVEVPDYFTADRLDEMTREIEDRVLKEHHVIMTAVGFYSQNTKNDEAAALREKVRDIVMSFDHVLQMHGFYVDQKQKMIRFDVVVDFLADDVQAVYTQLVTAVQEALPDYQLQVTLDTDTSD